MAATIIRCCWIEGKAGGGGERGIMLQPGESLVLLSQILLPLSIFWGVFLKPKELCAMF